jgi:hypothetical protein
VARREGRSSARISDFTKGVVALNEATRCLPDRTRHSRYRELQSLQDDLSLSLRGVFARHRALVAG